MRNTKALISERELMDLAFKVVYRYRHTIPQAEREDVAMTLVKSYLEQEGKIVERFNQQSKVTTYIVAVLNRMCCGVIRKELKYWQQADELHSDYLNYGDDMNNVAHATVIADEINYLKKVLTLLEHRAKTIVFLAFLYFLKAKLSYVKAYDCAYKKNRTLSKLTPHEGMSKGQIYEQMALVVTKVEGQSTKPDAVRMWLNKNLKIIIVRLNGPFGRAQYDKESFQVLFEYFYEND